ncbi:MAG TPA: [Fe-Fe] hydrogenase large subunit C-terminal domain-containing protein [Bacteroidales bacterium]|nr:[Fe-Fe] hydrogenase large subunit C-terminal domain-containing protein [Bacteroidales bacterium]
MESPLLHINADLCKECYACIRICPVKAIELRANETVPFIADSRCIGCGSCLEVCHPKAIIYYDSRQDVRKLLDSESKVTALLDPSISAEFDDITDYRKFVAMVKQLGFNYVHETAFGVDLVAKEYHELVSNFLGKYYILANCPPIVSLVEKYHPALIENLAPIVNPMVASAKVARMLHGDDTHIVFIGPCLGAKTEAMRFEGDGAVDAVLMFDELRRMFEETGIKESTIEYADFEEPTGYKGSLFALSDGILQAAGLSQDMLTGTMVTIDGRDRVLQAIKQFEESIDYIRKNFNIFYCEGCIMGPGMKPNGMKLKRRTEVVSYSNKRLANFEKGKWIKELNHFSGIELRRTFAADDQRLAPAPKDKVEEILKIIDKGDGEMDLGCKACGYESCRDFAEAVANGIARTDMCINYSLRSKQEYIKSLKVTNEKLAKTQQALQDSEKRALIEKQATEDALETTQTMLRKLPTAVLIVDESLKIIASNESFITILGEEAADINEIIPGLVGADLKTLLPFNFYKLFQYVLTSADDIVGRDVHLNDKLLNVTIFSIRKNKIVGGVVRDMYMPEVRKEEVINRVTDVIEQNLELVQQIAFLLGEGASKTEKMLNSIIESHQSKEE